MEGDSNDSPPLLTLLSNLMCANTVAECIESRCPETKYFCRLLRDSVSKAKDAAIESSNLEEDEINNIIQAACDVGCERAQEGIKNAASFCAISPQGVPLQPCMPQPCMPQPPRNTGSRNEPAPPCPTSLAAAQVPTDVTESNGEASGNPNESIDTTEDTNADESTNYDIGSLEDVVLSLQINRRYCARLRDECENSSLYSPGKEVVLSAGRGDIYTPYFIAAGNMALGIARMKDTEHKGVQHACCMQGKMMVAEEVKRVLKQEAGQNVDAEYACVDVHLPISYACHAFKEKDDKGNETPTARVQSTIEQEAKEAVKRFLGDSADPEQSWRELAKLRTNGDIKCPRVGASNRIVHDIVGIRVCRSMTFKQLHAKMGPERKKKLDKLLEIGKLMYPGIAIKEYTLDWWYESVVLPSLANFETFSDALEAVDNLCFCLSSGRVNDVFEASERIPFDVVSDDYVADTCYMIDFKRFFSELKGGKPSKTANDRKRKCIRGILYSPVAIYAARALVHYGMPKEIVAEFLYYVLSSSPSNFCNGNLNFIWDRDFLRGNADDESIKSIDETVNKGIDLATAARARYRETGLYRDITSDVRDEKLDIFNAAKSYLVPREPLVDDDDSLEQQQNFT